MQRIVKKNMCNGNVDRVRKRTRNRSSNSIGKIKTRIKEVEEESRDPRSRGNVCGSLGSEMMY